MKTNIKEIEGAAIEHENLAKALEQLDEEALRVGEPEAALLAPLQRVEALVEKCECFPELGCLRHSMCPTKDVGYMLISSPQGQLPARVGMGALNRFAPARLAGAGRHLENPERSVCNPFQARCKGLLPLFR